MVPSRPSPFLLPQEKRDTSRPRFPRRARKTAFTLVETTIAIGIVAFAMLPILGLVPMGLGTFRDAITHTAEAQIVQGVSNEILLTDYAALADRYASPRPAYYSDEGELLQAGDPRALFALTVTLQDVAAPASSALTPTASKSAVIAIHPVANPSAARKYSVVIPKS